MLADILDAERPAIVERWVARLARDPSAPQASHIGLRDHIPQLMSELTAALRTGSVPDTIMTARAHGVQREMIGFDLELLVREYGLLRDLVFDVFEAHALPLVLREVRIITAVMTLASAQAVDAYVRRQEASDDARKAETRAQRKQLEQVLDALPVLVSFVTAEERYALVNRAYEEWFDLPREAVLGRTLVEVIGAAAYARLAPFVRRGLGGERFDFEQYGVPYLRGGTRDVRVSFIPRHDESGAVSGYVALLADITGARRLEQEREGLLVRTEFLLTVAAAVGERLDANAVMQRLVHVVVPKRGRVASVWTCEEDGSLHLRVLAPAEAAIPETLAGSLKRAVESRETLHLRDGEDALLIVPIWQRSRIAAVLAVTRAAPDVFSEIDIELFETVASLAAIALENARLFEETEHLRATAEHATAAKDDFLARVSHDLRNPLGSVLGWSNLLRSSTDEAQIARGLAVIERNAKAQVQLIDDLLDVSRIVSGRLSLAPASDDVRVAVDTALDPARLTAQTKGVTLSATVADDVGRATVDPDRFRQIVWNLVSNAVKFTPAGGRVDVAITRISSVLRIVVTDNGRGIAPEFLPRVFERFEQQSVDGQRTGGLGLGLAIVRHLVELHGGTIRVESPGLGQGATFTVEMPVGESRELEPPASVAGALRGRRVLVIDDQEDLRELVSALLEGAGAKVQGAASADEAMAFFLRARPDALVSDVGMPGKDGHALMREIRRFLGGARLPAVALTALAQPKDRAEALAAGFDEHLTKPIDGDRLVAVLVRLLQP